MKKQSFINNSLRPNISGSFISNNRVSNNWKTSDFANIDILVLAPNEDATSIYFTEVAMQLGYKIIRITYEDLSTLEIINYLVLQQIDIPIYLRTANTLDFFTGNLIGYIYDLLKFHNGKIINRPSRSFLNFSKPLQFVSIGKNGNDIISNVETIITNCFIGNVNNKIVKSISSVRSTVHILEDYKISHKLNNLVLKQEKLIGFNIRVHVIGERIVALKVISKLVDYRADNELSFELITLDKEVANWCLKISKYEKLTFSGIDLFFDTNKKKYYCFEINPEPGYHYFEKKIQDRHLTLGIIDYLLNNK